MIGATYKVSGVLEFDGREFCYNATLHFSDRDERRPDNIEVDPSKDLAAYYSEHWEEIDEKALDHAYAQFHKSRRGNPLAL